MSKLALVATLALIGLATHSTTASAAIGRMNGSASVSSMGAATYTIPLELPKGTNGLMPSLALTYSSNAGQGLLGPHWNLSGQLSITRCKNTTVQDGGPGNPTMQVSDSYCLDGNKLRLTAGSYAQADSQYRTELDSASLITARDTAGNGPQWFEVRGKNGLIYEYGRTAESRSVYAGSNTAIPTGTVTTWMLSNVHDRSGNYMSLAYVNTMGGLYPDTISYAGTASNSPNFIVKFNYGGPLATPMATGMWFGSNMSLGSLLSSVTISNGSEQFRSYQLTYFTDDSAPPFRTFLQAVQECGATTADCLPPTTFTWGYGAPSSGATEGGNRSVPTTFGTNTQIMDMNGDGFDDIVYYDTAGTDWWVMWGSPSGFSAPVDTGASSPQEYYGLNAGPSDIHGDGRMDLLIANGIFWYELQYLPNNTFSYTFIGVGTYAFYLPGFPADIEVNIKAINAAVMADVNGDGYPDLVSSNYGEIYVNLNAGDGTGTFAETRQLMWTSDGGYIGSMKAGSGGPVNRNVDFDGDGRQDLYVQLTNGSEILYSNGTTLSRSPTGVGNYGVQFMTGPVFPFSGNSDGCTDGVFTLYTSYLNVSTCDRALNSLANWVSDFPTPHSNWVAIDWFNDGIQELLVYASTPTGVGYAWQLFKLRPTLEPSIVSVGMPTSGTTPFAVDVDGDGRQDLLWVDSAGMIYYQRNTGTTHELVTGVTDGYGNTTTFNYQPTSSGHCYSRDSGAPAVGSGNIATSQPMTVVCSLTANDGVGGNYTLSYNYFNANKNVQGRGFVGFERRTVTDSRTGIVHQDNYRQDFPFIGQVSYSLDKQTPTGPKIREVTNTFADSITGSGYSAAHFPYGNTSTVDSYEVGGAINGAWITRQVTSVNSLDLYGNVTNTTTTVTDEDSGSPYAGLQWITTTATTIGSDTVNWCFLPSSTSVTNTVPGSSIIRSVSYPLPDYVKCRQNQKITEPNSNTYSVTEAYGYDNFGNVSSITTSGSGVAPRTTSIDWGTTGQFPISTTNALIQRTQTGYDPKLGVLLSTIDPNGISTLWQYDAFGRKTRETRPDGTYTIWAYNDCASSGGCLIGSHALTITQTAYNADNTVLTDSTSFLDAFDRPLVNIARNLAGGYDRTDIRYDNLGRVQQQSMPCAWSALGTPCSYWTTYTYDALNRAKTESRPINAGNSILQTTNIAYQGRTKIVTDPQGKQTTTISTVTGALGRLQDHNGYYQNFTYDAFGSLLAVTDSQSNPLISNTYAYGIAAFKTGQTDMDLGSWGYAPNALGEVTAYTDANSASFNFTYDLLSRPLTRTNASEGLTSWTWGNNAASFNIGRLYQISSAGGPTETYSYDTKGRIANRHIASDFGYDYDFAYSTTTGLLDTLTYPFSTAGYRLKLQYNYPNGVLNQVKDYNSSTIFWQANSVNSRGQVTQEALGLGNGALVTNRSFDPVTGWLNSIQCGVGSGACAQNQSYLYDQMGNLTQRQNNNLGLTENFYYDNLYRLQSSKLNNVTNLTMGFDVMGNITSKSDVAGGATWSYDGVHKHRVLQAGNSNFTYSYDSNGNAITRNGFGIVWNKYNYPTVINGNGESASLFYDANQSRWKQVYVRGATTETTIYVGGLLEKVSVSGQPDDYRHYISANGQAVAIMSRTASGSNTTRYLLRDGLGSIAKMTDSNGAEVVSENFSAYGSKRNPATWSGLPTNGDQVASNGVTREGFTGQDALGNLGLNHMNGRVQDAITGRFLSADPNIDLALGTQGFNRFSYVGNNPLSYTDPSGYASCSQSSGSGLGDMLNHAVSDPNAVVFAPVTVEGSCFKKFDWADDFLPKWNLPVPNLPVFSMPTINIGAPQTQNQQTSCPRSSGLSANDTPVPFTDDFGNPVPDINGNPMERPAGWDPHFFTSQGADNGTRAALSSFRIGGAWDAQRMGGGYQGGNGAFHRNFVDFANVNIGLFASAAGFSQNFTLSVANGFAAAFSNMGNAPRDATYSHLRAANVYDISVGYRLQQSGAICTGH